MISNDTMARNKIPVALTPVISCETAINARKDQCHNYRAPCKTAAIRSNPIPVSIEG